MKFGGDNSGGGDTGAAGECFAFDAALVGAHTDLAGAENLDEIHVGAAWREVFMETDFVPEVLDHGFVSVGNKNDCVRDAGVEGMNRSLADGKLDLFVEAKVFWVGEIHADAVTFEGGRDNARDGLKTGAPVGGGDRALDVPGETTGAIATHLGSAAVVVVEVPGPI